MIPQVEQEYTQLTRDYDVYRQNYDALLKRRESVTMSGEVESKTDTVDFRVIDPPFVPSQPAWPNRPLLLSLVTLGGLGRRGCRGFPVEPVAPHRDRSPGAA